jgi:outer membrane receptor protein involved in Fe transport
MTITKNKNTGKSRLTGASLLAVAAAIFGIAPATAQEAEEEEAIVVTGTRLVRQDFEAISPVTTVGSEQLELTATLTTESLLNELPQIVPGNMRTSNNAGGEDFATVDLRGLGVNRTLVLLNGERIPGSSTLGTVDINTIPPSLISRIEVVTGGASAVYGSDAMAGVINFVLKDDYEGAEVNLTYGSELETGNVAEFEMNGLVGGNFANGRGNLTVYSSYYDRDGIFQSEYDYSRVSGAICYDITRGASNAYFVCDTAAEAAAVANSGGFLNPNLLGGSSTPPWGWIANNAANPFNAATINASANISPFTGGTFNSYDHDCNPATPNIAYGGASLNLSFSDAGTLSPRLTNGACFVPDRAAGSSYYNFAPDNYLVAPAERVAFTASGHYDITDSVRLNVLVNYANARSEIQLAPTPATSLTVTLTPTMRTLIQNNHPDLWDALQSRPAPFAPFVINRRTNEVGARTSKFENNSFYFLAGLEGSLGENWDWNLIGSYGQVLFNTRALNSVNATALRQGLSGCATLTAGGDGILNTADDGEQPLGVNALPGCVALDLFGPGTLDSNMQSFIRVNTFTDVTYEENRIAGYVRGDLFELPGGPIAAVFGFEYRDTYAGQFNDNEQRSGNIFGFNAIQDQEGSIDVYELYTEMAIPLISEAPFAHYLGLELGYRRSNYSSVGNVDTYKIGGEWAPVDWLRFRGVFNEATRAPNVFELFRAGDQGFVTTQDPCIDVAPADGVPDTAGVTAAECIATGVPAGLYPGFAQQNAQLQAFGFGNPNLGPETAETSTYGVVFQPDWFPVGDLRATADYYDIEISDAIVGLGAAFILNDCYVNNNPMSCARLNRNPADGQFQGIGFGVNTTVANQALLATSGYDLQLEWSLPVGPGQLTVNELYSILDSFSLTTNATVEFAGTTSAGIGGAFPDYKSVLTVSYAVGDWTLFGRWTYFPEVVSGPVNGFGVIGDAFAADPTVSPEASYFDVSARWNVTDAFTLTANIDNVFDDYPPQTADGYTAQANTDPQIYRVLGRTFTVSGRYRF